VSVKEKIIAEIIERVNSSIQKLESSRVTVAKDLFWARHVVNWKLTKYGNWTKFCIQCVKWSNSGICSYVVIGSKISKFNYTDDECEIMVAQLGWGKFKYGLMHQKTRLSVKGFIRKYKNLYSEGSGFYTKASTVVYILALPTESSGKLDAYLVDYGMTIRTTNTGRVIRRGMRDAMIQLIEHQLD
jgi:hypothetical protein